MRLKEIILGLGTQYYGGIVLASEYFKGHPTAIHAILGARTRPVVRWKKYEKEKTDRTGNGAR